MTTLLRRFHAQPGQTPAMLEPWRTREGRTSYQVMVDEVASLPRESRLLDLACGDGYLLSLLAQDGFRNLVGVDQSPEELARARARLGPGAELHCQEARTLPVPDASVDMTVCHWALMVVEPVDPILAEVARVLRPGSSLVAIVNRYLVDPVNEVYRKWMHRTTAEAGLTRVRVGDPRAYTTEGLTELIRGQAFDGESLIIHDFEVSTRLAPPALWASLRLMYDVFQLPSSAEATLERRLLSAWKPHLDGEGLLTCAMGLRLLRCRTPALRTQP
jgi:SAM-dependent methyltransferase